MMWRFECRPRTACTGRGTMSGVPMGWFTLKCVTSPGTPPRLFQRAQFELRHLHGFACSRSHPPKRPSGSPLDCCSRRGAASTSFAPLSRALSSRLYPSPCYLDFFWRLRAGCVKVMQITSRKKTATPQTIITATRPVQSIVAGWHQCLFGELIVMCDLA